MNSVGAGNSSDYSVVVWNVYGSVNYVTEPQYRIEIYRKLAQANEKSALEKLQKELRDRFGPLPPAVELLLQMAELKFSPAKRP